jgi:hypothetical protein
MRKYRTRGTSYNLEQESQMLSLTAQQVFDLLMEDQKNNIDQKWSTFFGKLAQVAYLPRLKAEDLLPRGEELMREFVSCIGPLSEMTANAVAKMVTDLEAQNNWGIKVEVYRSLEVSGGPSGLDCYFVSISEPPCSEAQVIEQIKKFLNI